MKKSVALSLTAVLVLWAALAQANPQKILQLFGAGNLKWQTEPLQAAIQEIEKVDNPGADLQKFHGLCLLKIGYIRFYQARMDKAAQSLKQSIGYFESALKRKPKDLESMFGRSMAYLLLGNMGPQALTRYAPDIKMSIEAMEQVDRYHFLTIQAGAIRDLVLPKDSGGEPQRALDNLTMLLTFEPQNTDVMCWQAIAQTRLGKTDQARATLNRVLSINPDHLMAKKLLEKL